MSGEHTSWKGIVRLPDPHAREVQMAYVDGYILAMEDLLEELSKLQLEDRSGAGLNRYRPVRRVVGKSLEQARQTLKHLKGEP